MQLYSVMMKNLWRRPSRTVLTLCGLAIAVAAVVSLRGVAIGFRTSLARLYQGRNVHLVVQQAGSAVRSFSDMPQSLADEIATDPEVDHVMISLIDGLSFPERDISGVFVKGWPEWSDWFDYLKVIDGRRVTAEGSPQIMIGRTLARHMEVNVGDHVPLLGEDLLVVGIYESDNQYEDGGAVMMLDQMQRLLNRPGRVTAVLVSARHPNDHAALNALRARLTDLPARVAAQKGPEAAAGTDSTDAAKDQKPPRLIVELTDEFVDAEPHIRAANAMSWIISGLGLAIGAIGMLNTMFMAVAERVHEIGALRAIGWKASRVMRMIVGESMLLSLAGFLLGVAASKGMLMVLTRHPTVSRFISSDLSWNAVWCGLFAALGLGLFGSLGPAWWTTSLTPARALQRK